MRQHDEALVSVIIPTHNRLHYLQEALASVLNQTYSSIEVIVCDNASTDGTYDFLKKFDNPKVIYVRHEELIAPLDNWNSWIDNSNGILVTFLPDDDKLAPEFIEKSVKAFADKDTVLVKSGCFVINEKSGITSSYLPFKDQLTSGLQYVFDRLNPRYFEMSLGSGYMFYKQDFVRLGGFMDIGFPKMHFVDDYLWFRIALGGKNVRYLNENLWYYRDHSSNMAIVSDLHGFRESFNVYVPALLVLLKNQGSAFPEIINYIEKEYSDKIIRDRVLGELSKNRQRRLSKSIPFLYKNRRIVGEYFGTKRIVSEFFMCIFSRLFH